MITTLTVPPTQKPQKILSDYLQSKTAFDDHQCALCFSFRPYWKTANADPIELIAIYRCRGDEIESLLISDKPQALLDSLARKDSVSLAQLSKQLQRPVFRLQQPLVLQTCAIPKPWGQEIWYTGVEERGVCGVGDGEYAIPLPWLLYLHAEQISKGADTLVLLKILDPLPDPTFGDLYFEMHEQKQEVYVVTHVDKRAWPDGVGAIRFGFNQDKIVEAKSREDFLGKYREAVSHYRQIRQQIDSLCDEKRAEEGIGLNAPVDATTMRRWLTTLPVELINQEQRLRDEMYTFTAMCELRVGDVVSVPNFVPHSLQHGVRTVEFQTPVYERKILSFAQKVLTQSEWDTESALPLLQLDAPKSSDTALVEQFDGAVLEKIVDFDDFHAFRLRFQRDADVAFQAFGDYCLVMSVIGELVACGCKLREQQAAIIPTLINKLSFSGSAGSCLLLCAPKSPN